MPLETSIKLVYIGPKPVKKDNVTGSAFVWVGYGDCQEVPMEIGRRLMEFPTVWVTEQAFAEMQTASNAGKAETDEEIPVEDGGENAEDQNEGGDDEQPAGGSLAAIAGADRHEKIRAAILSLEKGNEDHFSSKTGAPLIGAVKAAMGDDSLSVKEVSAAWSELKAGATN